MHQSSPISHFNQPGTELDRLPDRSSFLRDFHVLFNRHWHSDSDVAYIHWNIDIMLWFLDLISRYVMIRWYLQICTSTDVHVYQYHMPATMKQFVHWFHKVFLEGAASVFAHRNSTPEKALGTMPEMPEMPELPQSPRIAGWQSADETHLWKNECNYLRRRFQTSRLSLFLQAPALLQHHV